MVHGLARAHFGYQGAGRLMDRRARHVYWHAGDSIQDAPSRDLMALSWSRTGAVAMPQPPGWCPSPLRDLTTSRRGSNRGRALAQHSPQRPAIQAEDVGRTCDGAHGVDHAIEILPNGPIETQR